MEEYDKSKKSNLRTASVALSLALTGLGLGAIIAKGTRKEPYLEHPNIQRADFERNVLEGPIYSESVVPAGQCAKYTRLAAKDLFGIEYPRANAWDIRKNPEISNIRINSEEDLENLARQGILKPGMRVGFYYPISGYNGEAVESGAGYTHVALVIEVKDREIYFADKFGKKTRTKIDLASILRNGNLEPREVLFLSR